MQEVPKKTPRPVSEVQKDYTDLCLKAGHLQYQIDAFSKDLRVLNETLRELNFEAAASQQAAKDATTAPTEAPSA